MYHTFHISGRLYIFFTSCSEPLWIGCMLSLLLFTLVGCLCHRFHISGPFCMLSLLFLNPYGLFVSQVSHIRMILQAISLIAKPVWVVCITGLPIRTTPYVVTSCKSNTAVNEALSSADLPVISWAGGLITLLCDLLENENYLGTICCAEGDVYDCKRLFESFVPVAVWEHAE